MRTLFQDKKVYPKQSIVDKYNIFKKKHRIALGLCVHRDISPETMYCLMATSACPDPLFSIRMERGDALIERSRSILATKFLMEKLEDMLLFIDDDIIFNPEDAIKIADDVLGKGLDIVGGCYPTKSEIQPTLQQKIFEGQEIILSPNSSPVEVRYVSTGFMGISRKVLEAMANDVKEFPLCMPQKFFPFFKTGVKMVDGVMRFLGEDWNFCENAMRLGFSAWLDPSIRVAHAGRYVYTVDDINRPQRKNNQILKYAEKFSA